MKFFGKLTVCLLLLIGCVFIGQLEIKILELKVQLGQIQTMNRHLEYEIERLQSLEIIFQPPPIELIVKVAWLHSFTSLVELQSWLQSDKTDELQYSATDFDCKQFALLLQKNASEDGYLLSTEVLPVGAHWVNAVVIGDKVYFIEPQSDEIILVKDIG